MSVLIYGVLEPVKDGPRRWGRSCVVRARDDAMSEAGVRRGDYLVVERGMLPEGDALVVVRSAAGPGSGKGVLLLRSLERYGPRVRLQPGSGPLRPVLLAPEEAGIWGTVVAVLRKFEAA